MSVKIKTPGEHVWADTFMCLFVIDAASMSNSSVK